MTPYTYFIPYFHTNCKRFHSEGKFLLYWKLLEQSSESFLVERDRHEHLFLTKRSQSHERINYEIYKILL